MYLVPKGLVTIDVTDLSDLTLGKSHSVMETTRHRVQPHTTGVRGHSGSGRPPGDSRAPLCASPCCEHNLGALPEKGAAGQQAPASPPSVLPAPAKGARSARPRSHGFGREGKWLELGLPKEP